MNGFQSIKVTTFGGGGQMGRFYSRNACAGSTTLEAKVDNQVVERKPEFKVLASDYCYDTVNGDGGSNAIGSTIYTI